ncbi:methyltransferase domain-containing protein [Falsiroseomonas sp. E2-1-a20]|uniref:methyltransferase domain-containing protein n=1 Tax=Falsiroseomonas sp. E2-1-a20 TaxID=3239300 RepID=UPI003F3CF59C
MLRFADRNPELENSMSVDPEAIREFERASWNRIASQYEQSFASACGLFVEDVLDASKVLAEMQVLDVCCGTGVAAGAAARRGARVTGLDFAFEMLSAARRQHAGVAFEFGDAEALPFRDGHMDAVFSNFGIHHVPRPGKALRECHRVLCPGGWMAFSIWAPSTENVAMNLVHEAISRHGDPSLTMAPPLGDSFTTADDCDSSLRDSGFQDVQVAIVQKFWRHADARSLVQALQNGTARMGARLTAQSATAMPDIIAGVDAAAARYRDGDGIAVPMAAIVGRGKKQKPG